MKVYIAGPMAGNMEHQDYRDKIKKILRHLNIEYICPLELDMKDLGEEETNRIAEVGKKHTDGDVSIIKEMIERDLAAIDKCNVMIVYTPFPSYGTDMEAFYHSYINKRITIVFSENPKSWMLGLGDFFVSSYAELERVITKCLEIESGDNDGQIDSDV